MKLKHIITVFALFISPLALVSCGDGDKEDSASSDTEDVDSASASVKSHVEIGQEMAEIMSEMMTGMVSVKDVESAEAFAAKVPERKAKMKDLLKAAKALPAPSDEDKAAVNKIMDEAQEKAGPSMMEAMMGMSENPEAEAIGKVMENAMQDEEMDKIGYELEAMYKIEGSDEQEIIVE